MVVVCSWSHSARVEDVYHLEQLALDDGRRVARQKGRG